VAPHNDADDCRAITLTLTEMGATAAGEALARIGEHEERILGGLTAEERRLLIRLLDRIGANGD
jgi:DNA-binding MarR family transcriptional regulator